jgi:hypothetical protein
MGKRKTAVKDLSQLSIIVSLNIFKVPKFIF